MYSNTCLLFKNGWRGINIDINPTSIDLFKILRPSDLNICTTLNEYEKEFNKIEYINFLKSIDYLIDEKNEEKTPEKISFNMILNLASVCNAESSEILWGFIENYYPKIVKEDNKLLNELLGYGVIFYKEFILPNKKYRNPSDKEKIGFKKLIEVLKTSSTDEEPEEIQTKIYEIGMSLKFENLKDWFSAFYQVILGQDQGPRLGSFIKFYGLKKTILLLEEKLLDEK